MAIGTTAALIGGAIIGGTIAGAKQGKVTAPPPRDYGTEGQETLADQIALSPQLFAAEKEYRPQYAQLDTDILKSVMPQISAIEQQATTSQRTADIADVEALGGRATEAFRAANPQLSAIQDALSARALEGGDSEIMQTLRGQALTELQRGGQLSADQIRDVEQQARAAFNARGIARSDAGAFAEALNRSRYSDQREAQRRQFAIGVDSADLQRQNYGSNLLGTTGQFLSQTSSDPFQAILGRSAAPSGVQGAGFSLQSQPQIFNPFDPYAGALNASNQQNIMDARTATSANRASVIGSGIGALGSLFGACWVARAAYGLENPRWIYFREWLLADAPEWLFRAYLRHGRRVARWLEGRDWARALVRGVMDRILQEHAESAENPNSLFPLLPPVKLHGGF